MSDATCTVDGCERRPRAKGYCSGHYRRLKQGQSVDVPLQAYRIAPGALCEESDCDRPVKARGRCCMHYRRWLKVNSTAERPCTVEGCEGLVRARDMCNMHYSRWKKGSPLDAPRQRILTPPEERWCVVDGCDRRSTCLRMCDLHYGRWRLNGSATELPGRRPGGSTICEVASCARDYYSKGLCKFHWERQRNGIPLDGPRRPRRKLIAKSGYVYIRPPEDSFLAGKRYSMAEHRYVLEQMIGRPLKRSESVHHKNGNRCDNRPENLELWVSTQPSGQRPADLVAWAHEILRTYGPLVQEPRKAA